MIYLPLAHPAIADAAASCDAAIERLRSAASEEPEWTPRVAHAVHAALVQCPAEGDGWTMPASAPPENMIWENLRSMTYSCDNCEREELVWRASTEKAVILAAFPWAGDVFYRNEKGLGHAVFKPFTGQMYYRAQGPTVGVEVWSGSFELRAFIYVHGVPIPALGHATPVVGQGLCGGDVNAKTIPYVAPISLVVSSGFNNCVRV